jgi:hypothetical protein
MFTLNSFLKITEVAKSLGYFFRNEGYAFILTKMCWAIFWSIFSQTHLRGVFQNGFLCLWEKLAPRREVCAYANVGLGSVRA